VAKSVGRQLTSGRRPDVAAGDRLFILSSAKGGTTSLCMTLRFSARRAATVVIDRGPPVVAPNYPRPADPNAQQAPVGCADQLSKNLDKLPPGTSAALEELKTVPKHAAEHAYATCALVDLATSDNPANDQNVFNDICKGLDSAWTSLIEASTC
jgi:hypothetical protein